MKKLLCTVLCAACLFTLCVPALAAQTKTLAVTVGEETVSIPAYEAGAALPELSVTGADQLPKLPQGVSADVTVTFLAPDENGVAKAVFSGDETAFAAYRLHRNGTYTYLVTPGGADTEYRFLADVDVAKPNVRLSTGGAALGETLAVYVDFADGLDVSATTTLSYKPQFYNTAEGKMALLPISYFTVPGTYELVVNAGGNRTQFQVTANKRDFVVQNLTVDSSTASSTINNDAAVREWNELIEPLKYITDPQKYWDGKFLLPVQGRITTQFGTIRYTNGSKNASRHGATDIAAATGTPVPAANAGRVIFAQYIQMSGNVVVIEHGMGLKTWYFHMNGINTKTGDMVKKGDIIGTVGATGFVTGPHLHFGMSVGEVYINPMTAVENGVG